MSRFRFGYCSPIRGMVEFMKFPPGPNRSDSAAGGSVPQIELTTYVEFDMPNREDIALMAHLTRRTGFGATRSVVANGTLPLNRGSFFPPHKGGKCFFNFPPRVSKSGGEIKISPPGSRNMGGK